MTHSWRRVLLDPSWKAGRKWKQGLAEWPRYTGVLAPFAVFNLRMNTEQLDTVQMGATKTNPGNPGVMSKDTGFS